MNMQHDQVLNYKNNILNLFDKILYFDCGSNKVQLKIFLICAWTYWYPTHGL